MKRLGSAMVLLFLAAFVYAQNAVGWNRIDYTPQIDHVLVNWEQEVFNTGFGKLLRKKFGEIDFTEVTTNGFPTSGIISDLQLNPKDPDGLMFARGGDNYYRSEDGGNNWVRMGDKPDQGYQDVFFKIPGGALLYSTGAGLYYSYNKGDSWTLWATGERVQHFALEPNGSLVFGCKEFGVKTAISVGGVINQTSLTNSFVQQIAVSPDGYVFCVSDPDSTTPFPYIYRSLDKVNWDKSYPYAGSAPFRPTKFAFGKNQQIYVGTFGYGVIKSEDNGDSWFQTITGISNDYRNIESLTQDKAGYLYANSTCLWQSKWSAFQPSTFERVHTTNRVVTDIIRLADNRLLATFLTTGTDAVAYSIDDGANWTPLGLALGREANSVTQFANGNIALANSIATIYISDDNGVSWQNPTSFSANVRVSHVTSKGSIGLACGSGSVFTSYDNGANWTVHYHHMGVNSSYGKCFITDNGTFLVAEAYQVSGGYIHRSTDSANTWTEIPASPAAGPKFRNFAQAPNGTIWVASDSGVYYSTDDGENWTLDTEHPKLPSKAVCVRANGDVESSTDKYIYRKKSGENNWEYHSIPEVLTTDYFYDDPKTGKLYVSSLYRTVDPEPWVLSSIETRDFRNAQTESLIHLYPNPAFDRFVVDLSRYKQVNEIQVFDVQGRIVLNKDIQETSGEQMEVDCSNWPNGNYFILLSHENGISKARFLKR